MGCHSRLEEEEEEQREGGSRERGRVSRQAEDYATSPPPRELALDGELSRRRGV